jgi:hypothetical protein
MNELQSSLDGFDEAIYLKNNPDVLEAVNRGHFTSGLAHYLAYGQYERRSGTPQHPDPQMGQPKQYGERQWRDVRLPHEVLAVPTMIGWDERKVLYSLARDTFSGQGVIVDAGAFVGGSTLVLGKGLAENVQARRPGVIHSFDMFRILDEFMARLLYGQDPSYQRHIGESCRSLYDFFTQSIAHYVTVHEGNICESPWDGTSIEILFLDIMKAWETSDYVLREFFPALIPRRSIVVQQDYVHEGHYWIHIVMEYLREYFDFIEFVELSSTIYLLLKPIPMHVLEGCRSTALTKTDQLVLMDRAIDRWQGYPRGVLECSRVSLRLACKTEHDPLAEIARIREDYAWSPHVLVRASWLDSWLHGRPAGP